MTNENLKVGDVINGTHSQYGLWCLQILEVYTHPELGDGFSTCMGFLPLTGEGTNWQRGIHPSLIPEDMVLVNYAIPNQLQAALTLAEMRKRKIEKQQAELEAAKKEIERLKSAIRDAAEYHRGYVEKLKVSDPDRSLRQQERVNYFVNILENKS